jgi:hypothetical protein
MYVLTLKVMNLSTGMVDTFKSPFTTILKCWDKAAFAMSHDAVIDATCTFVPLMGI